MILLLANACQPNNTPQQQSAMSVQALPAIIDFNFHVKPILSDRCFKCHGPDEKSREGNLRLDTQEGAFAALGENKDHYAIISGDSENSTLVQRILSNDPLEQMPPPVSNLELSSREKEILSQWIEQGAQWKEHWSFLPLKKPALPDLPDPTWAKNEIDYFILQKQEQQNLSPNPAAVKERLARRVFFDLTGLSPNLQELDRFIQDQRSNAYELLIDSLLQTDSYAENRAVKWLDLARYADTHGYQDDFERTMWPWRDWVIHAFKQNMPYDQFVRWQLAGDLMPNANKEQIIATAFNRNHKITQEGGVIDEEYRVEYVADRTHTFGTAFLGLTFECARCHDHKYDPILQKDYYSLFGFFNNIPERGLIENYGEIPEPFINISKKDIEETLQFIRQLDTLESVPLMVMEEMPKPRKTYILNRGAYDQHGTEVSPNTPEAILAFNPEWPRNRLGLSKWLFDPQNHLTARVLANRLWQQCFGKGIVSTAYDFGSQGDLPSHPELLDWLAVFMQENNWDIKKTLKYILMSATYQQDSDVTAQQLEIDPENRFLSRASRLRLSAEMVRDHFLKISGLLVEEVGGPSVKPYQPEGLWAEITGGGGGSTAKYVPDTGKKLYRRSLYSFWKRTVPPPNMITFDAASRDVCSVTRQETSTPLQALVLMNDPQVIEAGRVLATNASRQFSDQASVISQMFRLATSRKPSDFELQELNAFYDQEKERFQAQPEEASAFLAIGPYPLESTLAKADLAAYAIVANAIFNLEESICRN